MDDWQWTASSAYWFVYDQLTRGWSEMDHFNYERWVKESK